MELEKIVLPRLVESSPWLTRDHVASFWELATTRMEYCSVDTKSLLSGLTSWDQVLERLNATYTPR